MYKFVNLYMYISLLFLCTADRAASIFLDLLFGFFSVNKWLGELFLSIPVHLKIVIKVSISLFEVSDRARSATQVSWVLVQY